MALVTNFKNFFGKFVGGVPTPTPEIILECPSDNRWMILGLDIANITSTGVQVDVIVYNSDELTDYYLVKSAPIPVGSSLQIISKQKHVLESGDIIKVYCNVDNSLNIIGSYMNVYTV